MDLIVEFPQGRHESCSNKKHRVSFAKEVEAKIVERLRDKYKDGLWFSSREMASIKNQTAQDLRNILVKHGGTTHHYANANLTNTSVFMDLEPSFFSINTPMEIKYRRYAIAQAVRLEQRRQLDAGVNDPEIMANACMQISRLSRTRANVIGLLHANEDGQPVNRRMDSVHDSD